MILGVTHIESYRTIVVVCESLEPYRIPRTIDIEQPMAIVVVCYTPGAHAPRNTALCACWRTLAPFEGLSSRSTRARCFDSARADPPSETMG